jgi:amino-acid N-acetyltransferase
METSGSIVFEPAGPADMSSVRALLVRCGLPTDDLVPASLAHFIVCRIEGALVGTIALEPLGETGLLRSLAVAPEWRGRRIAHELWVRLRRSAESDRIRHLYLLTTTADQLFSRWGFVTLPRQLVPDVVRVVPQYASLCPSTATVMAMDLTADGDRRRS